MTAEPGAATLVRAPRRGLLAVVAAAALVAIMSVLLHGVNATTGFDTWVARPMFTHLSEHEGQLLLKLSTPALTTGLLALIALGAALLRRWEIVALAVIGPSLALGLTELVLKPLVDRSLIPDQLGGPRAVGVAFPSGHETGLAALTLVVALLVPRTGLGRIGRAVTYGVLIVWTVLAAIGLVRGHYHYPTDTVGGAAVSVAAVLGVALLIDRWVAALAARSAQLT